MKVNAELDLPSGTTRDELVAALADIPGNAVASVQVTRGDRFGYGDTYALKFTWEVGNGKQTFTGHVHKPGCRCIQSRGQSESGPQL